MFKNITAISLAILVSLFFLSAKNVDAAPGLLVAGLAIAGAEVLGYVGVNLDSGSYDGMHDTLPPNVIKGPHPVPGTETYWCENTSGEKFVWNMHKRKWIFSRSSIEKEANPISKIVPQETAGNLQLPPAPSSVTNYRPWKDKCGRWVCKDGNGQILVRNGLWERQCYPWLWP